MPPFSLNDALKRLGEMSDSTLRESTPGHRDSSRLAEGPSEQDFVTKLSEEQRAVYTALLRLRGEHGMFVGRAGTGKSFLSQALMRSPRGVSVCAPTARAALGIGGITLDQMFSYDRTHDRTRNPRMLERMMEETRDVILVDEASMCGAKMAKHIHAVAAEFGKTLILTGDFAQASPVEDDWATETELFLGAQHYHLTEVHRQQDAEYLSALDDIRRGVVTDTARRVFFPRCVASPPDDDTYLRLTATNNAAGGYNAMRLSQSPGRAWPLFAYFSDHNKEDNKPPRPQWVIDNALKHSSMAHGAEFKIGARVVITFNDPSGSPFEPESRRFVNGDTGTIVGIVDQEAMPLDPSEVITDYFGGRPAKRIDGVRVLLDRTGATVLLCRMAQTVFHPSGDPDFSVVGIPLMLGWAMTIHRAQGITTDKVYVDLSSILHMIGESKHGLAYVALSRTRTLDGLLIGGWQDDAVYCSPHVRNLIS